MKVAFHAGQLLQPVPGGIGRYEQSLLAHLPGVGVDVVAFGAGPRPRHVEPRVPWIDLGRPHGSMRYELWHRLRRPVVRVDADVVHAPSLAVPPVGRRPLVVTVHDVAFLRVPNTTSRRGVSFHTRGLSLARRNADIIVAVSAFTRDELVREGFDADRVEVAYSGVDPPTARANVDIDAAVTRAGVERPYVLTVGTIEPRKDLPTVIAAVEHARAQHARLTLVVVGPPGWGEVYGLHRPFVRVLGPQPWSVVDALYRRADAFCIASRYEGFGLPALEAMACSAPVVATTGSAVEEIVGDAAITFAPGDVDACAAAITRLLDDPAERATLAARGRSRAAEFTWDRSAHVHARAYARALERHS